uniref:Uncharacterized protein n=1 Tax=Picea glauca TaxID=3330 RepID=A0A117NHU6_PICGL|nr:hypothetical protein ABT39_MTgene4286 [Picea glauca]
MVQQPKVQMRLLIIRHYYLSLFESSPFVPLLPRNITMRIPIPLLHITMWIQCGSDPVASFPKPRKKYGLISTLPV